MKKIDYGIDAPHVIRNLFILSVAGFLLPAFFPVIKIGHSNINISGFIWMGLSCGLMAVWMLLYSVYGKLKHRERILNMIKWKGSEMVLDVGTGRGLLMIGAAKRLTTGESIGIDIWNTEDLTSNNVENTLCNAMLEGVRDKVVIKDDNAINMSFADNTFDVVVTNLCLHNIYNAADRKKACNEIYRVLKKDGIAVISDFKFTSEYRNNFIELGMQTERMPTSYFTTFPPLAILKIIKS